MVERAMVQPHMDVLGPDGRKVGMVDRLDGDRIKLTRHDSPDGEHHYLDLADVTRVEGNALYTYKTRETLYATLAGAAEMTEATDGAGPLPPVLNRQVAGARPRGNYYLPWIVGAVGLLLLLLLLTRCLGDHGRTSTPTATSSQTTATSKGNAPPTSVAPTSTAGVSGLGGFLAGADPVPRTFTFENLRFDTAKAIIRAEDAPEIGRLADVLKQHPTARIRIAGFADARGSAPANARLGEERAEMVKAALVAAGIDGQRIETVSGGESNPVGSNATAGGQAENRRTELTVTRR